MTTYSVDSGARLRERYVDPSRQGSAWQQIATGILGVVLAAVLIMGQVSLATTRGIQHNLGDVIANMQQGNATMRDIVEKAAPSVQMERTIGNQSRTLAHTRDTMTVLNSEMARIGSTTNDLHGTVRGMRDTSRNVASGVSAMNRDTARIVTLLEPLPKRTRRTHGYLKRIGADSRAINGELGAISGKMLRYGLPHAKKVGR